MAEKESFPQIPTTVWWGFRGILQRSPKTTIDETFLGVELNVQPNAAKQYVAELKRIGMLDESGRATELAQQWRIDGTYKDAVSKIVENAYPQNLIDIAPPATADRAKVIDWFMRQGVGEGSARNRAATYLLVTSPVPGDTVPKSSANTKTVQKKKTPQPKDRSKNGKPHTKSESNDSDDPRRHAQFKGLPLNLNLQIHIGADASVEQIEAIFSAMRKYLSDDRDS